jgi:hypothetical protein
VEGVDDILAMLLAFSARKEELDILALTLTFGNVEVGKYVLRLSVFLSFPACGSVLRLEEIRKGGEEKRREELGRVRLTDQHSCLRNVVTLFQHIEKERKWRKEHGRPAGFETLDVRKPVGESKEKEGCK